MAQHRLMSCPAQPPWFCPRPVEAALGGRGALQPLLLHSCSCHLETTLARGSNFLYLITFDGSFPQDLFLLLFEPGSGLASSQYFDIKWVHWSSRVCSGTVSFLPEMSFPPTWPSQNTTACFACAEFVLPHPLPVKASPCLRALWGMLMKVSFSQGQPVCRLSSKSEERDDPCYSSSREVSLFLHWLQPLSAKASLSESHQYLELGSTA